MLIWRGLSPFTKEKICAVISGINRPSKNKKTGEMVQLSILPEKDLKFDKNKSVCGGCPLAANGCYVNIGQPVFAKFKTISKLKKQTMSTVLKTLKGKKIRFCDYGDPTCLPIDFVKKLVKVSAGWTGYSHFFSTKKNQPYSKYLMASVESKELKEKANALGWKTFRIVKSVDDLLPDEIMCPATPFYKEKTGKDINCFQCQLCRGNSSPTPKNITIIGHGSSAKLHNLLKVIQ